MPPLRHYRAFISYKHADNAQEGRRWAEWLHRWLEHYVVPPDLVGTPNLRGEAIPESLYPIFRDEDELPVDADLATGIRRALERSDCLIVLCSPRSAQSPWVRQEVRAFKELGKSDRILSVILAGEPNADTPHKIRDGISTDDECFPLELRTGVAIPGEATSTAFPRIDWTVRTEPLAADLRPRGQRGEGFTSHAAYKEYLTLHGTIAPTKIDQMAQEYGAQLERARMKIVAGILCISLGMLEDRDARHRAEVAEAEAQRQKAIAARERTLADAARRAADEAEAANRKFRLLLAEASRSDRATADARLQAGDQPGALAYLARACDYDPESSIAAEKAVATLNTWRPAMLETLLLGHTDGIDDAVFSPDGLQIVTAAQDATARIWETATGKLVTTLSGHDKAIWKLAFSFDGRRLVTASADGTARVWERASGNLLAVLRGHEEGVLNAAFSPQGNRIVTGSADGTARIWDAATGQSLAVTERNQVFVPIEPGYFNYSIDGVAFSSDGTQIVTAAINALDLWDAATGKRRTTLQKHEETVFGRSLSCHGDRVVTAYPDNTARVWDIVTGKPVATLKGHEQGIRRVCFSPDGQRIGTASSDKTARIWDASSGKLIATLRGHADAVVDIAFDSNGSRIITGSGDNSAILWDATTTEVIARLIGHEGTLNKVAFSPDGRRILTASSDHTARLWDMPREKLSITIAGPKRYIGGPQFSPDGQKILARSWGDSCHTWGVWGAADGKLATSLSGKENPYDCELAAISPDGRQIVSVSSDRTALVWEMAGGRIVATLAGHGDEVFHAAFSPDGRRIVTSSRDMTARVWDAATGAVMVSLRGHSGFIKEACFTADGRRILTVSHDKTANLWDAASGTRIATLPIIDPINLTDSPAFSPDGERVVIPSENWTACIWNAKTGGLVSTLQKPPLHAIVGVVFSPDGRQMITESVEGSACIWDSVTTQLVATLPSPGDRLRILGFTPDSRRTVAAAHNTALVWETATGREIAMLRHNSPVNSATISRGGERVVTTSHDGLVRIWDVATGKVIGTLPGHEQSVTALAVSPDGLRLTTTSNDNTMRLWSILLPDAGIPPEWFADFLRYLAQKRLNSDGEIELLKTADCLSLRDRLHRILREKAGRETASLHILRHFFATGSEGVMR